MKKYLLSLVLSFLAPFVFAASSQPVPVKGDLSGTTSNATVMKIRGKTVPDPVSPANDGMILSFNSGVLSWVFPSKGISGIGVANSIPLWTGEGVMGNSAVAQTPSGNRVLVGGATDNGLAALQVNGSVTTSTVSGKFGAGLPDPDSSFTALTGLNSSISFKGRFPGAGASGNLGSARFGGGETTSSGLRSWMDSRQQWTGTQTDTVLGFSTSQGGVGSAERMTLDHTALLTTVPVRAPSARLSGLLSASSLATNASGDIIAGSIGAFTTVSASGAPLNPALNYTGDTDYSLQPWIEAGTLKPPYAYLTSLNGVDAIATANDPAVPFAKVYESTSYDYIYGPLIPVQAGETLYGEMWAWRANGAMGTAGALYFGLCTYDKDLKPISPSEGLTYPFASAATVPANGVWTKYAGSVTLPLTHTPYAGSDGGACRYVRLTVLVNNSAGTIPTRWGGVTLRRKSLHRDAGPLRANGSFEIGSLSTGATNTVLTAGTANIVESRAIDSRVWGSTLLSSVSPIISAPSLATDATGKVIAGSAGSGRNPGVTKVVAASNSVATAGADYIATGTNDQATIATALTAAGAGGRVLLLEGTYNFGAALTMNADGQVLEGQGRGTVLKRLFDGSTTTNAALINLGLTANGLRSGMAVKNLTLDGNKAVYTYANNYGVRVDNHAYSKVTGCYFKMHQGTALAFADVNTFSEVSGNSFELNAADNIAVDGSGTTHSIRITNNVINGGVTGIHIGTMSSVIGVIVASNSIYGASGRAIYVEAGQRLLITNNTADCASGGSPWVMQQTVLNSSSYNTWTGNVIRGGIAGGMDIQGSANVVENNSIYTAALVGLRVAGYANYAMGRYNRVSGNIIAGSGQHGLYLVFITDSVVTANVLYDNGGSGAYNGIYVANDTTRTLIENNMVTSTVGTGHAIELIGAGAPTSGNTLAGNTFSGAGAAVILDSGANNRLISQWDGASFVTTGVNRVQRLAASTKATALVAGDFLLTGWGASAAATVTAGSTDMAGRVTVTTNVADTPTANPTLVLTFKDGGWTASDGATAQAPFVVASYGLASTGPTASVSTGSTATTATLRFNGTPTATSALTYVFAWNTVGGK